MAESENQVSNSKQVTQQLQDRIGQLEMELSAHFSSSHASEQEAGGSIVHSTTTNPALIESSGDSDLSSDTTNLTGDTIFSVEEMLELRNENEKIRKNLDCLRVENSRLLEEFEALKKTAESARHVTTAITKSPQAEVERRIERSAVTNMSFVSGQQSERSFTSPAMLNESHFVQPIDDNSWVSISFYMQVNVIF